MAPGGGVCPRWALRRIADVRLHTQDPGRGEQARRERGNLSCEAKISLGVRGTLQYQGQGRRPGRGGSLWIARKQRWVVEVLMRQGTGDKEEKPNV